MPVQKGKKRRRRLRRAGHGDGDALGGPVPATPDGTPKGSARPIMRRGWQAPLWVNLAVGTVLVLVGIVFFFVQQKGSGTGQRLIFLLLYFVLAGLYYGKALRQWRAKQQ